MKQSGYWTRTVTMLRFYSQVQYSLRIRTQYALLLLLQVRNNHYPSLQIVIEHPQLLLHTFSKPYWTFSIHVILLPIKAGDSLCVLQATLLQLCKYYKHVLQSWAWDHDCHITAYDLSRQRRRSVILVYIPHEITVQLQLSSQTVALSGL